MPSRNTTNERCNGGTRTKKRARKREREFSKESWLTRRRERSQLDSVNRIEGVQWRKLSLSINEAARNRRTRPKPSNVYVLDNFLIDQSESWSSGPTNRFTLRSRRVNTVSSFNVARTVNELICSSSRMRLNSTSTSRECLISNHKIRLMLMFYNCYYTREKEKIKILWQYVKKHAAQL